MRRTAIRRGKGGCEAARRHARPRGEAARQENDTAQQMFRVRHRSARFAIHLSVNSVRSSITHVPVWVKNQRTVSAVRLVSLPTNGEIQAEMESNRMREDLDGPVLRPVKSK